MPPIVLICGPQARPSEADVTGLRSRLHATESRLSRALLAAILELPEFWSKQVLLVDPELACSGVTLVQETVQWLQRGARISIAALQTRALFSCLANFLIQIFQYSDFIGNGVGLDSQFKNLGGVVGFCTGFLSAMVVAASQSEDELMENAIRALRLASCIGACVDKDAADRAAEDGAVCISVRDTRGQGDRYTVKFGEIIQNFSHVSLSSTQASTRRQKKS